MVVAVNYELSGHGEDTDAVFSDVVSGCQLTACLPARVGHVLNNQLWNVFPFFPPPSFQFLPHPLSSIGVSFPLFLLVLLLTLLPSESRDYSGGPLCSAAESH